MTKDGKSRLLCWNWSIRFQESPRRLIHKSLLSGHLVQRYAFYDMKFLRTDLAESLGSSVGDRSPWALEDGGRVDSAGEAQGRAFCRDFVRILCLTSVPRCSVPRQGTSWQSRFYPAVGLAPRISEFGSKVEEIRKETGRAVVRRWEARLSTISRESLQRRVNKLCNSNHRANADRVSHSTWRTEHWGSLFLETFFNLCMHMQL